MTVISKNIDFNELVLLIPHANRLGLRLLEKQGKNLVIEMPFSADLEIMPGTGIMANGAMTAFLDTALGAAVHDQFDSFRKIATLDLRVDYFDKPKPYSSVTVKTRCLKITDHSVFVQGDAYCEDEAHPIAHVVGVFSYIKIDIPERIAPDNRGEVGQVS